MRITLVFTVLFTNKSRTRACIMSRRVGETADAHATETNLCWKIYGAWMSFSEVCNIFIYSSSKSSPAFKEMAIRELDNTEPIVNHQPKMYGWQLCLCHYSFKYWDYVASAQRMERW